MKEPFVLFHANTLSAPRVPRAVDDHSRPAYSEALDDEKADTAARFWLRAVAFFAKHGITPIHRVLTDNGSCYRSRATAVHNTGTKHKRTTSRTNGKVERWHSTLAREWPYARNYTSETDRLEALADFLNFYNHQRPRSALDGQPPITRACAATRQNSPQPYDISPARRPSRASSART